MRGTESDDGVVCLHKCVALSNASPVADDRPGIADILQLDGLEVSKV